MTDQATKTARAHALRLFGHDLKNPLTAVRVLAEMLAEDTTDPAVRQDLHDILEATDMAVALVDGMGAVMRVEADEDGDHSWMSVVSFLFIMTH